VGLLVKSTMMGRSFVVILFLLIDFIFKSCSTSTPISTPQTSTPIPPPVQGPAVLGDNVEIKDWEYLGPESVESFPSLSANVREVGKDIYLVRRDYGFDLVWIQLPCATEPVMIVHADAVIEFWPAAKIESTEPPCEAMGMGHMLTVRWETDIPFDEWKFIFHPPPEPEA
jgi:hypothetical protein